jgi:hypothetical protein
MVWPILISVAVTPRISAAPAEKADSASAAPNPVTAHLATNRIARPLFHFLHFASGAVIEPPRGV